MINKKILTFLLIGFSANLLLATTPANANVSKSITVTTTGEVKVTPDAVKLNLTLSSLGESNQEAINLVSLNHKELSNLIKKNKISSKYVKSENLSVYPEYSYDNVNGKSTIIGYRASQNISITLTNSVNAGEVIDEIVGISNNITINSATPTLLDSEKAFTAAQKKAISLNKARALTYAKSLGVKLGKAISLKEGSTQVTRPPIYSASKDAMSESTVIDLGTETVAITVTVTWLVS